MSAPSPSAGHHEVPLKEAHTLLTTFTTFLTVSIHNILYYRRLYPASTFLSSRAYNLPVHQNRHPKVCAWVRDAVAAVSAQLAQGAVDRVAVVVHAPLDNHRSGSGPPRSDTVPPPGSVLERYLFDVSRFPCWPGGADAMRDYGNSLRRRDEEEDDGRFAPPGAPDEEVYEAPDEEDREEEEEGAAMVGQGVGSGSGKINWTDVEEQFRGVLRRLSHAAEKLDPVPEGSTFTVAVELRDQAAAPIGHPQPWIPSEPNLQKPRGVDLGGAKTTPVRSVEAGPLYFECWVEEGKAKDMLKDAMPAPRNNTQSSLS